MKRLTAILILSLYILTNVNLNVFMHYCGDEISSVTFLGRSHKACGCGDETTDDGCCKDTHFSLKKTDKIFNSRTIFVVFEQFHLLNKQKKKLEQKKREERVGKGDPNPIYIMDEK